MDVLGCHGAPAGFSHHLLRERTDSSAHAVVGPQGEKKTQDLGGHTATIKQTARHPAMPRRLPKTRDNQPLATESSGLGLSKNCSSSVDPLSAVVDDWAP